MNDPTFQQESASRDDPAHDEEPPQFGALDIVEAFTAMRHEWRGQTKESRALAEQVQVAVRDLRTLESKLLARVDGAHTDDSAEARELALLLTETDHQLSRAVAAIAQWETHRRLREQADTQGVERFFDGMSALARWFARPLLTFVVERRPVHDSAAESPAIAGLELVLARLRRAMRERGIERLDAEGQAFDANTMHAIGTVAASDCPSGHVAEQLSSGYRWQGRLLRFADVRVAK